VRKGAFSQEWVESNNSRSEGKRENDLLRKEYSVGFDSQIAVACGIPVIVHNWGRSHAKKHVSLQHFVSVKYFYLQNMGSNETSRINGREANGEVEVEHVEKPGRVCAAVTTPLREC
jgi:hypothetical protein